MTTQHPEAGAPQHPSVRKKARAEHKGPEQRRPEVLDTALSLALAQGVRAVSMEGIATALQVTRPVVYACFSSRSELLNALFEREQERLFSAVMAALPPITDYTNPEHILINGYRAVLQATEQHADAWNLVFAKEPDPAIEERSRRLRGQVSARLEDLLRMGMGLWQVPDADKKLPVLVSMLMAAGDTAVQTLIRNPGQWTPDSLAEFTGGLMYGLLKKSK